MIFKLTRRLSSMPLYFGLINLKVVFRKFYGRDKTCGLEREYRAAYLFKNFLSCITDDRPRYACAHNRSHDNSIHFQLHCHGFFSKAPSYRCLSSGSFFFGRIGRCLAELALDAGFIYSAAQQRHYQGKTNVTSFLAPAKTVIIRFEN
jgi:hypothetical protein